MEQHEQNLLEGMLRASKTFLVMGAESPQNQLLDSLKRLTGPFEPIDLKAQSSTSIEQLRNQVLERAKKNSLVVFLIDKGLPTPSVELLSEVTRRELKTSNEAPEKLADDVMIAAISGLNPPEENVLKLFPLRLSGMKIVKEIRAAQDRAEEELRLRQQKARESSKKYGLV